MNATIQILKNAYVMFFGNFLQTLKFFSPYILISVLVFTYDRYIDYTASDGIYVSESLIVLVLIWIALSWSAIAFHRHHLIGEKYLGLLPKVKPALVFGYMFLEFRLLITIIPIFIFLYFAFSFLGPWDNLLEILKDVDSYIFSFILTLALIPFYWFVQMVYPAAAGIAIGKPIGIVDAWRATRKFRFIFLLITIFITLGEYILLIPHLWIGSEYFTLIIDLTSMGFLVAIVTSSYQYLQTAGEIE